MYFHYFVIISPWKRTGPSFEQTWIPFTQGYFVPSLVEIGPVVLEKKMKMWKVYRRTDGQTDRQTTDDRWSEKLTWAFSSGELKTKVLSKCQSERIACDSKLMRPYNVYIYKNRKIKYHSWGCYFVGKLLLIYCILKIRDNSLRW